MTANPVPQRHSGQEEISAFPCMEATSGLRPLQLVLQAGFWCLIMLCTVGAGISILMVTLERPDLSAGMVLLMVTLSALCFGISYAVVKMARKAFKRRCVSVVVDALGLHRRLADGHVETIRYSDLRPAPASAYDVYIQTVYRRPSRLKVHMAQPGRALAQPHTVNCALDFRFTMNRLALIGHFIRGIRTFRPELRISDTVYTHFFIDPQSHQPLYRERFISYCIACTAALVVMMLIIFMIS